MIAAQRRERRIGSRLQLGRYDNPSGELSERSLQCRRRGAGHCARRLAEGKEPDSMMSFGGDLGNSARRQGARIGARDGGLIQCGE
jgi:hypothetical protein